MKLINHLNEYFGTEHKSVSDFIRDFNRGDLGDDYDSSQEKLTHVLMFLNSYGKVEENK